MALVQTPDVIVAGICPTGIALLCCLLYMTLVQTPDCAACMYISMFSLCNVLDSILSFLSLLYTYITFYLAYKKYLDVLECFSQQQDIQEVPQHLSFLQTHHVHLSC